MGATLQRDVDLSPASVARKLERWRSSPNFWRNAVEYAILGAVFWRIQASKRPDAMAQKLGVWDKDSAQALVGTRWKLNLDIGREVGPSVSRTCITRGVLFCQPLDVRA